METLRSSAPGRICLFGEHQDYLGLPVIAAAVSLRIGVEAHPRASTGWAVHMPDIGEVDEIDPADTSCYRSSRDYLRSSVAVLRRRGLTWSGGASVVMHGTIPINAGVSSSSAMVVMWLRYLLAASDQHPEIVADDLARLGHAAEVVEFGEPGGMMDHFCAAMGGVLHIDTRAPFVAERLSQQLSGIVLGHSLEPKATVETLGRVRAEVTEGVSLLRTRVEGFDLHQTPTEAVADDLAQLPAVPRARLRANLENRDITRRALEALQQGDVVGAGSLLHAHHERLRDGLGLSTPKIERMLDASMSAGALGGKINGSGGGGCMFALAPGREEAVADAIRGAGGVPYIVSVDSGARLE